MTNLPATITPYAAPFWEERAWDPANVPGEFRGIFLALSRGNVSRVRREMTRLEKNPLWSAPPELSVEREWRVRGIDSDIVEAHTAEQAAQR